MINLAEELQGVRTAVIAGHIRPDGDAEIGRASCRERV